MVIKVSDDGLILKTVFNSVEKEMYGIYIYMNIKLIYGATVASVCN